MLGAIAAIFIAIWFYKSSLDTGKSPIPSAILGLFVYFIPATVWTLTITPGLRDFIEHNPNMLLGLLIANGHVLVGIACSFWVKTKHFKEVES